jgi:hypothetical protein
MAELVLQVGMLLVVAVELQIVVVMDQVRVQVVMLVQAEQVQQQVFQGPQQPMPVVVVGVVIIALVQEELVEVVMV